MLEQKRNKLSDKIKDKRMKAYSKQFETLNLSPIGNVFDEATAPEYVKVEDINKPFGDKFLKNNINVTDTIGANNLKKDINVKQKLLKLNMSHYHQHLLIEGQEAVQEV